MTEVELIARLEKLERDNRRLKRVGVVALVLAAVLGAVSATRPVPQKITAHELDVVDDTGRVRVKLSTTPIESSVEVLNAQGNPSASMEVYPGVSYITAGRDNGYGAMLSSLAQGGASVGVGYTPDLSAAIAGKSGKALRDALKSYATRAESGPSVGMTLSPSGGPSLEMQAKDGDSKLGPLGLNFYDSAGKPAVSLMNAQGLGGLTFFGKKKQQIGKQAFPVQRVTLTDWGLDFSKEDGSDVIQLGGVPAGGGLYPVPRLLMDGGSPNITLSDPQGFSLDLGSANMVASRTGATQQTSAASIVMFGNDKKHRVIWRAP